MELGAVHKIRRQFGGGGTGQNILEICRWIEVKKNMLKVGWPLDVAWQNSSLQIFICFHRIFVPFEKKNEKTSYLSLDSNPRPLD